LGDFISVVIEDCFGKDMLLNQQITEESKAYSKNGAVIAPVFGEKKQSIIKKIYKRR